MSHDNFQPPEDPAFDEFVREQQAEAHWQNQLTDAYAEGRKDEREEWLPVLEALRDMLSVWKYLRRTHGDLYGVGWNRAQGKAEAAIANAERKS